MSYWEVELTVSGAITIGHNIEFKSLKGYDEPFLTNIKISKFKHGVKIKIKAQAENQNDANDAGLYFVGQALDYLSFNIDLSLYMSLISTNIQQNNDHVKRIVTKEEWEECFQRSRHIGINNPSFSRSLSWYRKALNNEDPIDSFLSYWNSIECVAVTFADDNSRTRRGVINKICNCFDKLWDNANNWKIIPSRPEIVNELSEKRNYIAHGVIPINIETVRELTNYRLLVKNLAHEFLKDYCNY